MGRLARRCRLLPPARVLGSLAWALAAGLFVAAPSLAQVIEGGAEKFIDNITDGLELGNTVNDVFAYEWNTDGDFEGWSVNNINNGAVTGGVLTGESLGDGSFPAGADPIFGGPADSSFVIGGAAGEVSRVQFRVQFNAGAPTNRSEIFLFREAGGFGSFRWLPGDFPEIQDGAFHTYTLDFDPSSDLWGDTISSFRLDPVADDQNNVDTFSYDFFRLGHPEDDPCVLVPAGDANCDGTVDTADFDLIKSMFFGINVGRDMGDLNNDGIVDLEDYGEWKDNFPGAGGSFLRQLIGVPEPSTTVLVLMGVAVVGARLRRRQNAA